MGLSPLPGCNFVRDRIRPSAGRAIARTRKGSRPCGCPPRVRPFAPAPAVAARPFRPFIFPEIRRGSGGRAPGGSARRRRGEPRPGPRDAHGTGRPASYRAERPRSDPTHDPKGLAHVQLSQPSRYLVERPDRSAPRYAPAAQRREGRRGRAGNIFYHSKDGKRRWVIYNGEAEASRVDADWHGWLHHTWDEPPTERPMVHKPVGTAAYAEPDRQRRRPMCPRGRSAAPNLPSGATTRPGRRNEEVWPLPKTPWRGRRDAP